MCAFINTNLFVLLDNFFYDIFFTMPYYEIVVDTKNRIPAVGSPLTGAAALTALTATGSFTVFTGRKYNHILYTRLDSVSLSYEFYNVPNTGNTIAIYNAMPALLGTATVTSVRTCN